MKRIYVVLIMLIGFRSGAQRTDEGLQSPGEYKEVVCFVYHRFGDSRYPTTNVSVKDFESHLEFLIKNEFQILTFSDAISYLQSSKPVKRTAVITIDDGYKSFFKNGLPLLEKLGVPATLFINTKTVGGNDYMNWEELKTASKSKVEIGNHTHSHDYFLNAPSSSRYKVFKEEIELSQSLILQHMQLEPKVFSFPYGEFDLEMKNIVKGAGFKAAAAQNSGVIYTGSDIYKCPRFPMSEAYAAKEKFIEKASLHALKIDRVSPPDVLLTDERQPTLTLTFESSDLRLEQLQCFVQGGTCEVNVLEKGKDKATVTLRPAKPITDRRRTLYTITIPDHSGAWHWYSHLWIDAKVD